MTKYQRELAEQIADAKKGIRKLKRAAPYIFVEYANMHSAKLELDEARKQYKEAKEAWDQLGN